MGYSRFKFNFYIVLLLLVNYGSIRSVGNLTERLDNENSRYSTSLIHDKDAPLVLSTLDGSFIGVERLTGQVRWTLHNDPVVRVPISNKNLLDRVFLPDPKDGSLYLLAKGSLAGQPSALKKLPFTIQQLVASSPCRSSDGIFYTGKKIDSWFSINWKSGQKSDVQNFNQVEKSCPATASEQIFIGRTEYNLLMYDSKHKNREWNVTFFDYSTQSMTSEEVSNYGYVHFGGSSSGRVSTYDRSTGRLLWDRDYGSPLVAVFLRHNQDLASVPFTSVEDLTLDRHALSSDNDNLLPSLYVGQHQHGLYALPALVGQAVTSPPPVLLIEGPNVTNSPLLGHYPVPDFSTTQLRITGRSDAIIPGPPRLNGSIVRGSKLGPPPPTTAPSLWIADVEHKLLYLSIILLIVCVVALFLYVRAQVQALQSQQSSRGSNREASGGSVTAIAEQMPDGSVKVGKINFDTSAVLGKGCEGTFVFRGTFESRAVAVKRLLPECFTVADREVSLLQESDAHANVVRYFCTEQDPQFRYIALELCAATLQDYVEKNVNRNEISEREVLRQSTAGLLHLHSLNIVHRDIKPHNVLLSMPGSGGLVRAMISDFGLCKKLQLGRSSFSRRSGITGTDGWIAPEIVHGNSRTMCYVDIFSLGCVFYYVISNGQHPFGDTLHRQANILSNEYKLAGVSALWRALVEPMISCEPLLRPSADVVLNHPALWDNSRILTFLQDVSDRVEKEEVGQVERDSPLQRLETGAHDVCVGDWRQAVDPEVTTDLRKYRSYRGDSVRDLLRALRNKRHHFRELSPDAQKLLGSPTDGFTEYWLFRFPLLLSHSWSAMQCVRYEPLFRSYYFGDYTFSLPVCGGTLPAWWYDKKMEAEAKKVTTLPRNSPRRSSLHNRRGSDFETITEDSNSCVPKCNDRNDNDSPQNSRKFETVGKEEDETEREIWMKSGQEKGVYRPRMRRRKKKDVEPIVLSVVPP